MVITTTTRRNTGAANSPVYCILLPTALFEGVEARHRNPQHSNQKRRAQGAPRSPISTVVDVAASFGYTRRDRKSEAPTAWNFLSRTELFHAKPYYLVACAHGP